MKHFSDIVEKIERLKTIIMPSIKIIFDDLKTLEVGEAEQTKDRVFNLDSPARKAL